MDNGSKWTNAVLYNKAKFNEVSRNYMRYKDPQTGQEHPQSLVSVKIEDKMTDIRFSVFTTHLKAKRGFEQMREMQAFQLIELI